MNEPYNLPINSVFVTSERLQNDIAIANSKETISDAYVRAMGSLYEPYNPFVMPETKNVNSWLQLSPPIFDSQDPTKLIKRGVIDPIFVPPTYSIGKESMLEGIYKASIEANATAKMKSFTDARVSQVRHGDFPGQHARFLNDYIENVAYALRKHEGLAFNKAANEAVDVFDIPLYKHPALVGRNRIKENHIGEKFGAKDLDVSRWLVGKKSDVTLRDMLELSHFFKTGEAKTEGYNINRFTNGSGKVGILTAIEQAGSTIHPDDYADYARAVTQDTSPRDFMSPTNVAIGSDGMTFDDEFYDKNILDRRHIIDPEFGAKYEQTQTKKVVKDLSQRLVDDVFVQGNVIDGLGFEEAQALYDQITNAGDDLGYKKKRTDDGRVRVDYEDDVFAKVLGDLYKVDENGELDLRKEGIRNYLERVTELLPFEEEELKLEYKRLEKELGVPRAQKEIKARREQRLRENRISELKAFAETFKQNRNDARMSTDDLVHPLGLDQNEMDSIYEENKRLEKVRKEETKIENRLLRNAFNVEEDGTYSKIKERIPTKPTDRMRMAILSSLNMSYEQSFSETYAIGQRAGAEAILEDINALQELAETDLSPKQREAIMSQIGELTEKHKRMSTISNQSFLIDMEGKTFEESVGMSWERMVRSGQNEVQSAIATKEIYEEELKTKRKELASQIDANVSGADKVFELHGISKEAAANIQEGFSSDVEVQAGFKALIDNLSGMNFADENGNVFPEFAGANAIRQQHIGTLTDTLDAIQELERILARPDSLLGASQYITENPLTVGVLDDMLSYSSDGRPFNSTSAFGVGQRITGQGIPERPKFKNGETAPYYLNDDIYQVTEMRSLLERIKAGYNVANEEVAKVGGYIQKDIVDARETSITQTENRIAELEAGVKKADKTIRSKGYNADTMSRTITEGDQVYQIGITKEQYDKYYVNTDSITDDLKRVSNHKVLVESRRGLTNVSSWVEAERKGQIINGGFGDDVGYTVRVSPDQKIAYLTQPAVKVSDLEIFTDWTPSNAKLVKAIKSGEMDFDIDHPNMVIEQAPVLDYTDKDFITLKIDETTREIFKESQWDAQKESYIKKDIDLLFEGRKTKGYNITDEVQDSIKVLVAENDLNNNMVATAFAGLEENLKEKRLALRDVDRTLSDSRRQASELQSEYRRVVGKQKRETDAEVAKELKVRAEEITNEIDAINEKAKLASQAISSHHQAVMQAQKEVEDASTVYRTGERIEGFARNDEFLELHNKKKQTTVLKEQAFNLVKEAHHEKETGRLQRVADLLDAVGKTPEEVNGDITSIRIDFDKFMSNFVQNDSATDIRSSDPGRAFHQRLRKFMATQFNHVDEDQYGHAAVGAARMFREMAANGKEINLEEDAYGNRLVQSISGGEVFDVSGLSEEQLADYNSRIEAYRQMTPAEKLEQVLFNDLRSYTMKEMFGEADQTLPAQAHQVQTFINELVTGGISRGEITPRFVRDQIKLAYGTDPTGISEQMRRISEEDIAKIMDYSAVSSSQLPSRYDSVEDLMIAQENKAYNSTIGVTNPDTFEIVQDFNQHDLTDQFDSHQVFDARRQKVRREIGFGTERFLGGVPNPTKEIAWEATRNKALIELGNIAKDSRREKIRARTIAESIMYGLEPMAEKFVGENMKDKMKTRLAALTNFHGWEKLIESENGEQYKKMADHMGTIMESIPEKVQDYTDVHIKAINDFGRINAFASMSLVDREAALSFLNVDDIVDVFNDKNIMKMISENLTENHIKTLLPLYEKAGKELRASVQVPGEDFSTEVVIRTAKDGSLEAYSHELRQGFALNESGKGKVATASTKATRAYGANNNYKAIQTASAPAPLLRTAIPTHSLSKRSGDAQMVSKITPSVVDLMQFSKDGSIIMGYDIETTLTGSKLFKDLVQPIDIFAEKVQFERGTGTLKRGENGQFVIDQVVQDFIQNPDGSRTLEPRTVQGNASFEAVIALDDPVKEMIASIADDPDQLIVNIGDDNLHIASIANTLEWKSGMTQKEQQDFNTRRNEFIKSRIGSGKNATQINEQINEGLDKLRLLSNVAKYSITKENRGNPVEGFGDKPGFAMFSSNTAVSSYEEALDMMQDAYSSGGSIDGLDSGFLQRLYRTDSQGAVSRVEEFRNSRIERVAVQRIQEHQTNLLIEAAQKAAEVLDSESLSKEYFGNDVLHFKDSISALKAFNTFIEMDDVAAVFGSNTELADNVTLIDTYMRKTGMTADDIGRLEVAIPMPEVIKESRGEIIKRRNAIIQDVMTPLVDDDFEGKFTVNPVTAEKFREQVAKAAEANGGDASEFLRSRSNIIVDNVNEAIAYATQMNTTPKKIKLNSPEIKQAQSSISRLTTAYSALEGIEDGYGVGYNLPKSVMNTLNNLSVVPESYSFETGGMRGMDDVSRFVTNMNSMSVIDQLTLLRGMYPGAASLGNEAMMALRGQDLTEAHTSSIDVRSGFSIMEDFTRDAHRAMNKEEVEFKGVGATVEALGITPEMTDIREGIKYRPGDFVYLQKKYDKGATDVPTAGQVGVYQVQEIGKDYDSMVLQRFIAGSEGMVADTSVPLLRMSELNSAVMENEVVDKLRFISHENDQRVLEFGQEYQADISREHLTSALDSTHSYYIQQSQLKKFDSGYANNPLFNIEDPNSLIDFSNNKGMMTINSVSPVDRLERIGAEYNAIMERPMISAVREGTSQVSFELGGRQHVVDIPLPSTDKNAKERRVLPKINLLGANVEVDVFYRPKKDMFSVRINPNGNTTPDNISDVDLQAVRNMAGADKSISTQAKYFTPEITKEHMLGLNDARAFNQTDLGQATRELMDDVTALRDIGAMDNQSAATIVKAWNEQLKAQAAEMGESTASRLAGQIEDITYNARPTAEQLAEYADTQLMETNQKTIEKARIGVASPVDVVDSITRISKKISRDIDAPISGKENAITFIANNQVLPKLQEFGFLPEGYNAGKEVVSLEQMGVDVFNHTQTNGLANPVLMPNYAGLGKAMDADTTASFKDDFYTRYMNNTLNVLTDQQNAEFRATKENLNTAIEMGRYVPTMPMNVPVENLGIGSVPFEAVESKQFFADWSVDDLIDRAKSIAGSEDEADEFANKRIYQEIAERAAGGERGKDSLDPDKIIMSGNTERLKAAEHLGLIEQDSRGIGYRRVEDITQQRLTYSKYAGKRLDEMAYRDIDYAINMERGAPSEQWNNASYQQMMNLRDLEQNRGGIGYDTSKDRTYYRGTGSVDYAAANGELIERSKDYQRKTGDSSGNAEAVVGQSMEDTSEDIARRRAIEDFTSRFAGATGQPMFENATQSEPEKPREAPQSKEPAERVIEEAPERRRLSEAEEFIDNTKSAVRDKMNTFLHGSSGGKWVAGLGVAAAALFTVNSMGGPLRLEDRPQGHGVKGFAGAPEDDQRMQRETKSVQVDTSNATYVNSGEKGYTIQARGRAGSNIDTGQLQNSVSGLSGASSVDVNIRDDRSSIDSNWLETQFSNYIGRGSV